MSKLRLNVFAEVDIRLQEIPFQAFWVISPGADYVSLYSRFPQAFPRADYKHPSLNSIYPGYINHISLCPAVTRPLSAKYTTAFRFLLFFFPLDVS